MTLDVAITLVIRALLAFILLRAAWHKLTDTQRFIAQLDAYRLLPERLLPATAGLLVLTETALATLLLVPAWTAPSLAAAGLFTLYALAMGINLARGMEDLDCGCSGPAASQSISWRLVIRNLALALLALAAGLAAHVHALSSQDFVTLAFASIAVILLYASLEQAMANGQRQRSWFAVRNDTRSGANS